MVSILEQADHHRLLVSLYLHRNSAFQDDVHVLTHITLSEKNGLGLERFELSILINDASFVLSKTYEVFQVLEHLVYELPSPAGALVVKHLVLDQLDGFD